MTAIVKVAAAVAAAVRAAPMDADLAVRGVAMDVEAEAVAVDAAIAMTARTAREPRSATNSTPTENPWLLVAPYQPQAPWLTQAVTPSVANHVRTGHLAVTGASAQTGGRVEEPIALRPKNVWTVARKHAPTMPQKLQPMAIGKDARAVKVAKVEAEVAVDAAANARRARTTTVRPTRPPRCSRCRWVLRKQTAQRLHNHRRPRKMEYLKELIATRTPPPRGKHDRATVMGASVDPVRIAASATKPANPWVQTRQQCHPKLQHWPLQA